MVTILVISATKARAMSTIQASEFKAKCLALMDRVARTGETITITKNGKPVAELRAHRAPRAASPIGLHEGEITIAGDIVTTDHRGLWETIK
jgi:antitoxin (DNA-binding transcriptional repressor) of toxin-antitoxin stability system